MSVENNNNATDWMEKHQELFPNSNHPNSIRATRKQVRKALYSNNRSQVDYPYELWNKIQCGEIDVASITPEDYISAVRSSYRERITDFHSFVEGSKNNIYLNWAEQEGIIYLNSDNAEV